MLAQTIYRSLVALISVLLAVTVAAASTPAATPPTLDDMWAGKAHFVQTGTLDWSAMRGGDPGESSSWFAIEGATWYAFNRSSVVPRNAACPSDNMRTVVRASHDEGRSWTAPVEAAATGSSPHGDGCAILDGASVYDGPSDTWHMLAQCLDLHNAGGWALCHYTRRGRSPLGRFQADAANPVVRPGQLWKPLCAGRPETCDAARTVDEGTPDIVRHAGGLYYVTFHGYDPKTGQGFRGMAATPDFHRWQTRGAGLPGGPILGPADCRIWIAACVGTGAATMLATRSHDYLLFEAMDRNLACVNDQRWIFSVVRAPRNVWPRSGSRGWQTLGGAPLIQADPGSAGLPCAVSYARWFTSRGTTWLVYEARQPGSGPIIRRLLKLVPGSSAERIVTTPSR